MELRYSERGLPYIYFDDGSYLLFSGITEAKRGFQFLCFNGLVTKIVKGKKGKTFEFSEWMPFSTTFKLTKIPKEVKACTEFSGITIAALKKIFKELTVDGYFPRSNLSKLDRELQSFAPSADDYVDDDETLDLEENWEDVK